MASISISQKENGNLISLLNNMNKNSWIISDKSLTKEKIVITPKIICELSIIHNSMLTRKMQQPSTTSIPSPIPNT